MPRLSTSVGGATLGRQLVGVYLARGQGQSHGHTHVDVEHEHADARTSSEYVTDDAACQCYFDGFDCYEYDLNADPLKQRESPLF